MLLNEYRLEFQFRRCCLHQRVLTYRTCTEPQNRLDSIFDTILQPGQLEISTKTLCFFLLIYRGKAPSPNPNDGNLDDSWKEGCY
jgi:hypothetical protein